MKFKLLFIIIIVFLTFFFFKNINSQVIQGLVTSNDQLVPFANIVIEQSNLIVSSNEKGEYKFDDIDLGETNIISTMDGRKKLVLILK